MQIKLLLSIQISLMALLLLSCASSIREQDTIIKSPALIITSSPPPPPPPPAVIEPDKIAPAPEEDDMTIMYKGPEVEESEVKGDDEHISEEAAAPAEKDQIIEPANAEEHYKRAISYVTIDELVSALDEYRSLINLDPSAADNLRREAVIMASANKLYRFIVQAGAYKIIDNANEMLERLKPDYMFAHIEEIDGLYKVRINGIKTRDEAGVILRELYEKIKIEPYLIEVP